MLPIYLILCYCQLLFNPTICLHYEYSLKENGFFNTIIIAYFSDLCASVFLFKLNVFPIMIGGCHYLYVCLGTFMCMYITLTQQRALLEQKQKKKRQEPLMVQSNMDGRSRTRRTKQSEEQAPLVESYLSSNSSTIYHGNQEWHCWFRKFKLGN